MLFKKKNTYNKFWNHPDGTEALVNTEDIFIPKEFKNNSPKKWKMERCEEIYRDLGRLDEPITVIAETNEKGKPNKLVLVDGYTRYLLGEYKMKLDKLPVRYLDIDTYCIERNIQHKNRISLDKKGEK